MSLMRETEAGEIVTSTNTQAPSNETETQNAEKSTADNDGKLVAVLNMLKSVFSLKRIHFLKPHNPANDKFSSLSDFAPISFSFPEHLLSHSFPPEK